MNHPIFEGYRNLRPPTGHDWQLAQPCRNTRRNVYLTHGGRTLVLSDWARELGMNQQTLWMRIQVYGWSTERALTTPVDTGGKRREGSLRKMADRAGMTYNTVWKRVNKMGWTLEEAISIPPGGKRGDIDGGQ